MVSGIAVSCSSVADDACSIACGMHEYPCGPYAHRPCVYRYQLCDGNDDCGNGRDEDEDMCGGEFIDTRTIVATPTSTILTAGAHYWRYVALVVVLWCPALSSSSVTALR